MSQNSYSTSGAASTASHAFYRAHDGGMGSDCPEGEEDTILDYYNGQILVMRADAKFPDVLVDLYEECAPYAFK